MKDKTSIITFWFAGLNSTSASLTGETTGSLMKLWFGSSSETDLLISQQFKHTLDELSKVAVPDLLSHSEFDGVDGRLALVVLFDQFTRNIYRNTPKMFSHDKIALSISKSMLNSGEVKSLHPLQQAFILLVSLFKV